MLHGVEHLFAPVAESARKAGVADLAVDDVVRPHVPPQAVVDRIQSDVGTEFPPIDRIVSLLMILHIRGLIEWAGVCVVPETPQEPTQ